jgi:hypothetical protein
MRKFRCFSSHPLLTAGQTDGIIMDSSNTAERRVYLMIKFQPLSLPKSTEIPKKHKIPKIHS